MVFFHFRPASSGCAGKFFFGYAFPILICLGTASETAIHKVGAVEGSVSELTRQTDNDNHLREVADKLRTGYFPSDGARIVEVSQMSQGRAEN
jgi:hypothetical protein